MNWTGLRKASLRPLVILAVICVRYVILPAVGIGIIKAAAQFGFLAADPLYHFVLMIQYTLPPAMAIGMKFLEHNVVISIEVLLWH